MKCTRTVFAAILLTEVTAVMLLSECTNPVSMEPLEPQHLKMASYDSGEHDGYFWSKWSNDKGSLTYSNTTGGYTVQWSNNGASDFNFTCGKGLNPGLADAVVTFSGTANFGNNGYLALYGWTDNPVVEYYVLESYGQWEPPGSGADYQGTFTSDGSTYKLYKKGVSNAPWIKGGNGNFTQYWSVRTSKRTSGTITFKNHVQQWESKGWKMGSFDYYQILETEGYGSSGSSDIKVEISVPTAVKKDSTSRIDREKPDAPELTAWWLRNGIFRRVGLRWTKPLDNRGIQKYHIYHNGEKWKTVSGDTQEYRYFKFWNWKMHTFSIRAEDPSGNISGYSNSESFKK